jgi:alpha-amylase
MYSWGDHYWMVEFDMDCSQNENGWFEVKAYLTNGGKLLNGKQYCL